MRNVRWIAVPVAALGLVFLLFGIIWGEIVQLAAAVALVALAAALWRITSGSWPLATSDAM